MEQGGNPADVRSRYNIKDHSQGQTASEIQQQVYAEHQAKYGPFVGALIGMLAEPGRVDDLLDAQAVQLKQQGVETRQVPAGPGAHYQGFSHQQLYDMVNNQVDPGTVGASGDTWTKLGKKFAGFTDKVVGALTSSEINWTGKAGDGARGALAKIANSAGDTGTAAQLAGTLAAQQSRALSTAKASVPPPPAQPFDPQAANAKRATITDPAEYAMQEQADAAAFSAQKQQHEEAARKVEVYDRTMTQVATAQPAFAPAPATAPKVPGEPNRPVVPNPGFTGQGNTPPPQVGNDTTNTSWTAPPTLGNGTTNTSGLNNNLGLGGANQQGLGGGNHQNNLGLGGGPLSGQNPGLKGNPSSQGGRAGGGPGGPGGSGRGGSGVGAGRMPTGGTGLGNPNAAKGFGPGGSAGVLPPGESAAGRGGAASGGAAGRGGAGAGAMGGMGAGGAKGKGDEDLERTTPSYLLEPDPDEVFGNPEMVAPPVIGE